MNKLQIFKSEQFGEIRVIEEDGNFLFCGSDVAKALGYVKPQNAISRHCRYALKRGIATRQGNMSEMLFIPEGDLYRLSAHSELPDAEKFESWIYDEVLPSIRKHGGYIAGQETLSDEELIAKAFVVAKNILEEKDKLLAEKDTRIEQMKPKEIFADAVTTSSSLILIGELAKILKGNGHDIGEKRLFAWLRNNGYLIKRKGADYNAPTQKSMELGLFKVKETAITHSDGHTTVSKTTKVTGKGQQYFINKFLAE